MSSTPNSPAAAGSRGNGIPRVIVATTALLTFISFWRAAAIVLNDLASSAYYAGGEAEGYIGKTAPWFILAIMPFSYDVRAVYVERCSMFVRGGVYRAVKMSLGGLLAKFSHSPLPPWPYPRNLRLTTSALGWLAHSSLPHTFGVLAVLIALGHSVLAMSGEESLAQVYREIESPKLPNLKKAGAVIFVYSLVFTSLVSFFAVMIIPDDVRQHFLENLIGGLAMNLEGPLFIRLIFHGFVVVVGTLILAGAVNTAIVGSNGVLNRVSEDGVLSAWFRQPHKKFGTSYRIINIEIGRAHV